MKMKKKVLLAALLSTQLTTLQAQELRDVNDGTQQAAGQASAVETTVGADVLSHYVWRGLDLGHASIQPTLGISWQGLSLTAFGSMGITDASDPEELDLTLAYQIGGLTIGITDYWANDGNSGEKYFQYRSGKTCHVFEGNLAYDFGFLSLSWNTNFAGNDGTNGQGKRAYSSYAELCVPFRLGGCEWVATAGIVPYATTHYETDGFSLTNLSLRATKTLPLSSTFSFPLFVEVTSNPHSRHCWAVAGFTLAL